MGAVHIHEKTIEKKLNTLVMVTLLVKGKEEFFLAENLSVFLIPVLEIVGDKKVGTY